MLSARLGDVLQRFKTRWVYLAPLLLLNLAGMVFGWYYYWQVGQFDPHSAFFQPVYWWPLVADSPNAVLLFFVALLAYKLAGWRNRWLDALAFTLNVYVGCWTTFIFLGYSEAMGTFDYASVSQGNANPILFIAHMGMPAQAFVLARDMRRDRWGWATAVLVLAFLAAFVYVDYWGPHLHPAPFLHGSSVHDAWVHWRGDRLLHVVAPWLMVGAGAVWLAIIRPGRRETAST